MFTKGTFHRIKQLLTHLWINCSGALRKMIGFVDMHNACILWHIKTDYTFTKRKDKGEVIGSLPPHNDNVPCYSRVITYVCNRKSHKYLKTWYTDKNDHITHDINASCLIITVKHHWYQLVLQWGNNELSWMFFFCWYET